MPLWNCLTVIRCTLRRTSCNILKRYKHYVYRPPIYNHLRNRRFSRNKIIASGSIAFGLCSPFYFSASAKSTQYYNLPTILITGSSQGIGRGIAIELARSKLYKLVLLSRNETKLNETVKLCHDANKDIEISLIVADISNDKIIKKAVKTTCEEFGPLSCLINNAGTYYGGEIGSDRIDLDKVAKCIDINLTSTIKLCQYCIPYIRQTKEQNPSVSCAIINIGSRAVTLRTCASRDSIYCATKFGLHGFAECLFHDLREYGIKVSSIHPGWTNTPLIPAKPGREFDKMIQSIDVAKTVQYILDCNETVCPLEIVLAPQKKCMPQRQPKKKEKKENNEYPCKSLH